MTKVTCSVNTAAVRMEAAFAFDFVYMSRAGLGQGVSASKAGNLTSHEPGTNRTSLSDGHV